MIAKCVHLKGYILIPAPEDFRRDRFGFVGTLTERAGAVLGLYSSILKSYMLFIMKTVRLYLDPPIRDRCQRCACAFFVKFYILVARL